VLCAASPTAPARRLIGLVLWVGCALAAGCGGISRPPRLVADRVCDGAQHAAAALLGDSVSVHIAGRDPADLECALDGRRLRVAIVSQASTQAYTEFDTTTAHQDQVFGSGVHEPGEIPAAVAVPGSVVAVWIRAQREIVATDAEPGRSGTYVTVTVMGSAVRGQRALALARAVARTTFAAHPETRS
jgi:hypothetical protein